MTEDARHHGSTYIQTTSFEFKPVPPPDLKIVRQVVWNRIREQVNRARDASFFLGHTENGRNEAAIADELELVLKRLEGEYS